MNKPGVLLVDDEINTLIVLRSILEDEYVVHTAEGGQQGLELFSAHDIRLVIADQRMPGMSGVEMLCRMRVARPDSIRIVLTAYTDFEAVLKAINEGDVYRFVLKPWNPDEMLVTIKKAIEHQDAVRSREQYLAELRGKNVELETAQQALVQTEMLAAVGKLAHIVVHEVGNVLLSLGFLDGLQEDHPHETRVATMVAATARMKSIVFGRLENYRRYGPDGPVSMVMAPVEIGGLVAEAAAAAAAGDYASQVEVAVRKGRPVTLEADSYRLSQVLVNLVRNACEACDPGGKVTVGWEGNDDGVDIFVTDNGSGISLESQERIFEPFFSTRGAGSLGLGLEICKQIIDGHCGTIECESTPGKGSTFTIHLPRESVC